MYGNRKKGKHTLSHDSIFKGKKDSNKDSKDQTPTPISTDIVSNTRQFDQIFNGSENERMLKLERLIYEILSENTDLDFTSNRRKPSRDDFNSYFELIVSNIDMVFYTKFEVFVLLSFYFSENLFNMMRLLDKRNLIPIIKEMREKFGVSYADDEGFSDMSFV